MARASYANSTFRRLANALVSLVTCEFQIKERFEKEHISRGRVYISHLDVPNWEPYLQTLFLVGRTTVILHEELHTALELAKAAAKNYHETSTEPQTYLLLSVRHMMVCYLDTAGKFSSTAPTTLMDGHNPPAASAIKLLLQALPPNRPPSHTPIHDLPLEIQDQILSYTSHGPIEAARLGCILGLGSPFKWQRAKGGDRRQGPVELCSGATHRTENSPVESKICFCSTL